MAHQKLIISMPARADLAFDAFHYHHWRGQWDSLVSRTQVQHGAPCPSVGAISENTGAGTLRALSMRTQFVSYHRPSLAAAARTLLTCLETSEATWRDFRAMT